MKKLFSVIVAAAILVNTLPATAAEANATAGQAGTVGLHASIARSAARLAGPSSDDRLLAKAFRESDAAASQGGGGGAHAGMMVMMLVSVAASVGGGYLIYKEMKKQTSQAAK
jgi:hypothetical protein